MAVSMVKTRHPHVRPHESSFARVSLSILKSLSVAERGLAVGMVFSICLVLVVLLDGRSHYISAIPVGANLRLATRATNSMAINKIKHGDFYIHTVAPNVLRDNVAEIGNLLHSLEMADPDARTSNPGFMLVTSRSHSRDCSTPIGTHLLTKAYKNKVDYCNIHGCTVRYILESWEPSSQVAPPSALLRLMHSHPSVQWFMWMDTEALFTNLTFAFPFHTYSAWGKHFVVPSSVSKKRQGRSGHWNAINPIIFLVKNSAWSFDFLTKWKEMSNEKDEKTVDEADMDIEEDMSNTMVTRDHAPLVGNGQGKEGDVEMRSRDLFVELLARSNGEDEGKVFVEDGYYLHGRGDFIVESHHKLANDTLQPRLSSKHTTWPFIVHFDGCALCTSPRVPETCLSTFQRAFHFADNQLLSVVGMRHQQLYTTFA